MWTNVASIVPEGRKGEVSIEHLPVVRVYSDRDTRRVERVLSACLRIGRTGWMSDNEDERKGAEHFVAKARGHVLIFGLGIGLILPPLMASPRVMSITVVEKHPDVIALVGPYYKSDKIRIVEGDFDTYSTDHKFDSIFVDIWPVANNAAVQHFKASRDRINGMTSAGGFITRWPTVPVSS